MLADQRNTEAAYRFLRKALKTMSDCPPSSITTDALEKTSTSRERRSAGTHAKEISGFSRPKLSDETEASYRSLGFDPLEAYYGFRRVKAAFRSDDIRLLARVAHYPLAVTGKIRRGIRNHGQIMVTKESILNPRIREVAARSTFETGFGLGAANLD